MELDGWSLNGYDEVDEEERDGMSSAGSASSVGSYCLVMLCWFTLMKLSSLLCWLYLIQFNLATLFRHCCLSVPVAYILRAPRLPAACSPPTCYLLPANLLPAPHANMQLKNAIQYTTYFITV